MRQLDESILQRMTERLVVEFDPEKVFLFGSHAWGTPTDESDLDLFVLLSESSERPLQRARRARACLSGFLVAKDVLVRTRSEAEKYLDVHASLESMIFEKGKLLYERH